MYGPFKRKRINIAGSLLSLTDPMPVKNDMPSDILGTGADGQG
jgi:hypothetical protein